MLYLVVFIVTSVFWIDFYLQVFHLLFRKKKKRHDCFQQLHLTATLWQRVSVWFPMLPGNIVLLVFNEKKKKKFINGPSRFLTRSKYTPLRKGN